MPSKSATTIRRRRRRAPGFSFSHALRIVHKKHLDEESIDLMAEDPDTDHALPWLPASPLLRLLLSSDKTLFLGLLALRIINALIIQTSYVPDEYWQSIEVAHRMAFGYGHLTWEWTHGLRSYLYPAMFASVYNLLALLHLDSRLMLVKVPRLMQAVIACCGDLYLFKFSRRLAGPRVAQWALFCQLTSWFTFYCCTRTLTNSLETVMTTIALYYYPWPGKARKSHWKYMLLVGLSVVIRPTAAILWLPLCIAHLWMFQQAFWKVIKLFAEIGFVVLFISSVADRICYGKWINVHYNFLQFNVLEGAGAFYGSHPWHWYFSQGFFVIMGPQILPFILGAQRGYQKPAVCLVLWTVCAYSFLAHKEFRFLFPVLPLAMHVAGAYINSFFDDTMVDDYVWDSDSESEPDANADVPSCKRLDPYHRRKLKIAVVAILLISNLPIAMYTSLLHQRGTLDVMKFIHDESHAREHESHAREQISQQNIELEKAKLVDSGNADGQKSYRQPKYETEAMSVLFLMPCHSTPYYGYVHRNISMRFLTCEPEFTQRNIPFSNTSTLYQDEAEIFYKNSTAWLEKNIIKKSLISSKPYLSATHLVMFDTLHVELLPYLDQYHYHLCAKFFHSHIVEGRIGKYVIVACRDSRVTVVKEKRVLLKGGRDT